MTIQDFDNTGWKAGTQVKVGNEKYHVWRIDFGLKRVQVPVNNEITTNMLWLHCLDFEVVKEPTAIEKHDLEKEAKYIEGVLIGLRICKELWAQGAISHEQIRENEHHYLDELELVREKMFYLENKEQ